RPRTVWARPKLLVSRSFALPFQPAVSVACGETFVPPAAPGAHGGGGFATVISRSSTGAELPAASVTLTIKWCPPSLSFVVSNGTSALTDAGHGCTYRNAANPSAVCPTFRQRPPFSLRTVLCTTCPSTLNTASYTPELGSVAEKVRSLVP